MSLYLDSCFGHAVEIDQRRITSHTLNIPQLGEYDSVAEKLFQNPLRGKLLGLGTALNDLESLFACA
ncbi:hypothetical protein GCM10025791_31070 [Halioxenophilus aromaticivorans]|uniref:Uncharacterized protein n=1 Tax=Halioxenophilus aromaticivorans TaxID=1306992 RepID=A0AAV3U4N0_9ALTE